MYKKIMPVMAAVLMLGAMFVVSPAAAQSNEKVTICHRTNSANNPYTVNTVDVSAIDGSGENDHSHHGGTVFDENVHNQQNRTWGDIIPPVDGVDSGEGAGVGKNWTDEGQAIHENGCEIPDSSEPGDPEPESSLTADTVCGEVTVTATNHNEWGLDVIVDFGYGEPTDDSIVDPELVIQEGPRAGQKFGLFYESPNGVQMTVEDGETKSETLSIPEDEGNGSVVVTYRIKAGPEQLLHTVDKTIVVNTDCEEDEQGEEDDNGDEEEEENGDVLGDTDGGDVLGAQVDAPVGGVRAGAGGALGSSATALLGLFSSLGAVGFGLLFRKWTL